MTVRSASFFTAVLLAIALAQAQGPPPALQDRFLDNFAGDWRGERKMGNGRTAETSVRSEWTLKHQFIELPYGFAAAASGYQTLVFLHFYEAHKPYLRPL